MNKIKEIEKILGQSIEQLLDTFQVTHYEQRLHLAVTLLFAHTKELEKELKYFINLKEYYEHKWKDTCRER